MQEDKNLKALLQQWATEHTATGFTSQVMQRITSTQILTTKPAFNQRFLRVLLGAFILVCMLLLILSFKMQAAILLPFTIKLPAPYLLQGFSFLIAFWVVMLLNIFLKKFSSHHSTQDHFPSI